MGVTNVNFNAMKNVRNAIKENVFYVQKALFFWMAKLVKPLQKVSKHKQKKTIIKNNNKQKIVVVIKLSNWKKSAMMEIN